MYSLALILLVAGASSPASPGYKGARWGSSLAEVREALKLGNEDRYPDRSGGASGEGKGRIDLPAEYCLLTDIGARYNPVWRFLESASETIKGEVAWHSFGGNDPTDRRKLFFVEGQFRGIDMDIDLGSKKAALSKLNAERGSPSRFAVTEKDPIKHESYNTYCAVWKSSDATVILWWMDGDYVRLAYLDPMLHASMKKVLLESRRATEAKDRKRQKDTRTKDLEKL